MFLKNVHQECPYVQEWIEGHVTGTTPYRQHYYDGSTNTNQHFSCIFCPTPLEFHQGMSNQTPAIMGLAGNTNTAQAPTTPLEAQNRLSQQSTTNRTPTTSSSAYPAPNSDMLMVCAKCRQVLPRCFIRMMSLTTYIEDASYIYEPLIDKHTLMSSQWFAWCRLCRHG
ncbi:unnamed protein product, partial [Rotaria sp. Silwood2]